jgi:hypothetical protein
MFCLTRKIITILMALAFCLSYQAAARAELQIGIEYQINEDEQALNTIKADWWLLPKLGVRGSVELDESRLAADLLYRKNPRGKKTAYMGLGVRDLFNSDDTDLSAVKRMEIIAGLEVHLTARLSLAAETRFVPLSSNRTGMKPVVGIGIKWIPKFGGNWAERVGPIEDRELDLLARLITAEAGQEPYEGQVAVGAVVLNRIKSGNFPQTIREVIYQDGQFSSLPKLDKQEVSAAALRAAKEAIAGADPSLRALYFYNPATCKPEGLRFFNSPKLQVTVKIGNHVFLKPVE